MHEIMMGTEQQIQTKTANVREIWPLQSYCSRNERKLLTALRHMSERHKNMMYATAQLEQIGLSHDEISHFEKLVSIFDQPQTDIRLLGPKSAFIANDEIELLLGFWHLPRLKPKSDSEEDKLGPDSSDSFVAVLLRCAEILRNIDFTFRSRPWPANGLRIMSHCCDVQDPGERIILSNPVTVVGNTILAPNMCRVTLQGHSLSGFDETRPGQWVKLFVPSANGRSLIGRAYTVRQYRPELQEFDIDFVLHDRGFHSHWAAAAQKGDVVSVSQLRGGYAFPTDLDWILILGDESALPAISSMIEHSSKTLSIHVFLELNSQECLSIVPTSPKLKVTWVQKVKGRSSSRRNLLAMARKAEIPAGEGHIWVAGEAGAATAVKQHFSDERAFPLTRIASAGYWRRGVRDHKDETLI